MSVSPSMDHPHRSQATDWNEALNLYEKHIARGSETLQILATVKLGCLSKYAPENVLSRSVPILVNLLATPLNNSSLSIQEAAAFCLNRLARHGDGSMAVVIGQSGAIPCLLRLLPQAAEASSRRVLIKCLWGLVTFASVNRAIVARSDGLEVVLQLFASCTDYTRRYLLEIVSALALLREVRRVIIGFGGLPLLVESARRGRMVSRARAAQAIGLLAVTTGVRPLLVGLGAIPLLVELLRVGDASTKLVAANALGIIASHVDYIRPVAQAGAIPWYADLLRGAEPLGKEIAADAFCVLAVAEENAISIAQHLVTILRGGDDGAKATALDVLWNLSTYKYSVSIVGRSGAIPIIVELLRDGNSNIRNKASGVVAQLTYDEGDRIALVGAGVIPLLISSLPDESEELMKDNAAEALINFSEDPLQRHSVSEALNNNPSFQSIQNRIIRTRLSGEQMNRPLRRITTGQFTWDPDLF
ncbi:PREDICTED: U-box domain-containing protein 10-like [Nelumbo nucifera]|uniref:U-box domain-containing protein 10-like n=2 Tax=Nelumbo nucifera TaxID=4432 RepID=A0A1U7ZI24_NELNU|nr:PREDICTED: U-box domain-containing protein 10-like [Nelumbo nucifera]DAD23609.1 TPA_asm: hypothetical protein HUJ06_025072 [Nelumbo nucifera]